METPAQRAARDYIKRGPPYWGISKREHSKFLGRKEGGAGGDFDFKDRKQWYAKTNKSFIALVRTGKWSPEADVDTNVVIDLMLNRTNETNELVLASKQREKEKKAASIRKQLGVPADEPALLKVLKDVHGIECDVVAQTAAWPELGPRSEISNARRVERCIRLNVMTADQIRARAAAASR
jgi:hypothetical protein